MIDTSPNMSFFKATSEVVCTITRWKVVWSFDLTCLVSLRCLELFFFVFFYPPFNCGELFPQVPPSSSPSFSCAIRKLSLGLLCSEPAFFAAVHPSLSLFLKLSFVLPTKRKQQFTCASFGPRVYFRGRMFGIWPVPNRLQPLLPIVILVVVTG